MSSQVQPERIDTVVIGAGQAGLSAGYHLKRRNVSFVILEAKEKIGDTWRQRWHSLRLFTPARYDGLPGMKFPGPDFGFPTKDEMADYLDAYARRFDLPVRTGVHVDRVSRRGERFLLETSRGDIDAANVVVAMATFQQPMVPPFAAELDPSIVQLHSSAYQAPSQLREGAVLIVGAGNSGAEIAMEVSRKHKTWLAGRNVGQIPFPIAGRASRLLLSRIALRFIFHRVLTTSTPMGRKLRPKVLYIGGPRIRTRSEDLVGAGVESVARVAGVENGQPRLADGRVLDVANVIWCTGFHPGFSWIDLPVFDDRGQPLHDRGVVAAAPGLFFVGLHFLYALSSTMIHGVGRDAGYIARAVAARRRSPDIPAPASAAARPAAV